MMKETLEETITKRIKLNEKALSETEFDGLRRKLNVIYAKGLAEGFCDCYLRMMDLTVEQFKEMQAVKDDPAKMRFWWAHLDSYSEQ